MNYLNKLDEMLDNVGQQEDNAMCGFWELDNDTEPTAYESSLMDSLGE